MSRLPFLIFRYQILPISRELQLDLTDSITSIEELLAKKNALFADALLSVRNFSKDRTKVTHKIAAADKDLFLMQFAANRNLQRETSDFRSEEIDNWPSFHVLIWNHPDRQFICLEHRTEAFQSPNTALRMLLEPINAILQQVNLRIHYEAIIEEKYFWQLTEKFEGRIRAVRFELVTPNMSNISATLDDEIKTLAKFTNAATTELTLESDSDSALSLKKSNASLKGLVSYAAKGGGNIAVRIRGYRKYVQTAKTPVTIEVDELEIADPKVAMNIIKTMLEK